MPRGEHFRKVTDGQIVSVFERDDLREIYGRRVLAPTEVAEMLNNHELEGEKKITGEAVRQRMHKIDQLETVEIGGAVLWKEKGASVFASHTPATIGLHGGQKLAKRIVTAEFWWNGFQLLAANLTLILVLSYGGYSLAVNSWPPWAAVLLPNLPILPAVASVVGLGLMLLGVLGMVLEIYIFSKKQNTPSNVLDTVGGRAQTWISKLAYRAVWWGEKP